MNRTHALIVGVSLVGTLAACRDEPLNPDQLSASRQRPPGGDAVIAAGVRHYVKPGGVSSGDGLTEATAWNLAHAFLGAPDPPPSGPKKLLPGDTVWILGRPTYTQDYAGPFTVTVGSLSGPPIVFRQAPDNIAILRRTGVFVSHTASVPTLTVSQTADYTEYWDFEIAHTNATRTASPAGEDYELPHGIWNLGDYTKFVNLMIHDAGVAFLNDGSATLDPAPQGVVLSGNIIYNNGWDDTDNGHGHGMYLKNNFATMSVTDNIIFNQFGHGIQVYTDPEQGDELKNIQFKGNAIFNNGTLGLNYSPPHGTYPNLGAHGTKVAENLLFDSNMLYFSSSNGYNLTYWEPEDPVDPNSTNQRKANYVVRGIVRGGGGPGGGADGWTMLAPDLIYPSGWTGPNGKIIRRTGSDQNRVNVVIFSATGGQETVDLGTLPNGGGTFLATGDSFTVRNALDFRNTVDGGRYNGQRTWALTVQAPPVPSGTSSGPTPGPYFNVFVVTRVPAPPPPAASSASVTGAYVGGVARNPVVTGFSAGYLCEYHTHIVGAVPGASASVVWSQNGGQAQSITIPDAVVHLETPHDGTTWTYKVRVDAPGYTTVWSPLPDLAVRGFFTGAYPRC